MAIVNKAVVRDSDGYVVNVIIIDEDREWNTAGETLILAGEKCELGGTYDKDTGVFSRAPVVEPTRTDILMSECMSTKKIDRENGTEENDYLVDKTADEIKAEKTELAALLKTAHEAGDLPSNQLNMRVRLNIEGY